MDSDQKPKQIANKEEELYLLQQVYKNLKYLNHMYETGKLKHESRAWYTQISVNNAITEVNRAERELEQLKQQA